MLNHKEDGCYICKRPYVHKHHIFEGMNRKMSEKYGMVVYLCPEHHNMSDKGVHFDKALDLELKRQAQRQFEETNSREEFIEIFHRNYL